MIGFSLNVIFSGGTLTSGGGIISSGAILSGGSILYSGGRVILAGISKSSGGAIGISGGTAVTVNTTLPEDSDKAYQQYITDKRIALVSGGTAILNDTSQIFSGGYAAISSTHLMSVNGVRGYADSRTSGCYLTIAPSVGIWAEHTSNGPITTIRALPPCITCDDYNKLFAAEMVLYHAINKEAWSILDNGVREGYQGLTGIWYRYQGLLAYWSLLTYSDAFLNYNCTVRENLAVNIGYANPSCDDARFVCLSVVSCTSAAQGSLQGDLIFYPGNMITSQTDRDNNSYNNGDPIAFIIAYTNNSGAMSGAQVYCGGSPGQGLVDSLTTLISGATVNGSALSDIISGGAVISSIQSFTDRPLSSGGWILGLAGNLGGQQYAAQPYTLGPAASTTVAYVADDTKLDTYSVDTTWWVTTASGAVFSAGDVYKKSTSATVFKTYSLQQML